jgi:tetratricopeptide (TPR) repeat protein
VTTQESRDPGSLSRLLEELAEVPRPDVPAVYAAGFRPGTKVGRFIIEREIGRGGFGVVYAALDPELGRTVALKLLKPGSSPARKGGEWLRREAEAVARLGHANIVTLHDFGRTPGGAYLVFELLRGETLSTRLARGPLPIAELLHVGLSVARALAHAHAESVLHRDLKPANIFLCAGGTVKVLDFGIAHLFEKDGPSTGGTPAYMAPEQWWEETGDARSDLFALGVLLHEMLTGTLPFGKSGVGKRAPKLAAAVPRDRAPARLRRLIETLTQLDPQARPGSTDLVVRELEAIATAQRERRRPWLLAGLVLVVAAVVTIGLLVGLPRESPAGERITAAIADAENATGDPDLDRLADLLAVALGESRRVKVLSRERLLAAGRGTSAGATARVDARIDARAGRLLAELAGAHVLLVPVVRREGDAYALQLRGEAPEDGATLFTARATAAGKVDIPAALDRIVVTARRELRERTDDLKRSPAQLAAMTTSSLPAFREYLEGVECMSRPSEAAGHVGQERCKAFFLQALGHDPSFALAHYQLAYLLTSAGATQPEVRGHMEGALRSAQRLSRRDAAVVLAWKAHLDGRDDEALATYGQILSEHPDDRHVLFLAGDLLFHRNDWAGAAPYFQALRGLDPDAEWPLDHLARCLAITGRTAELRELAVRLSGPAASAGGGRLAIRALVWLGDPPAAVALARRRLAAGTTAPARLDLVAALFAAGEFEEAEGVIRQLIAASPRDPAHRLRLLGVFEAQGRFAEAWRLLRSLPLEVDGLLPGELVHFRALLAAGTGELELLRDATLAAVKLQPEAAGAPLVLLALVGDPVQARALAASLDPGSTATQEVLALEAWRRGQRAEAAASMALLEQRDPWAEEAIAPAYLLAEITSDGGEPSEVVAAVGRFHRHWPGGLWYGWAWPRSLLLAARAEERLERFGEARVAVERLIGVLRRADRGSPLLAQALALRDRLGGRGAGEAPGSPRPPAP